MTRKALAVWAVVYVVAAAAILAPLSLHPSSRLPDDADSLGVLWILHWVATHIVAVPRQLLNANAYFPHPNSLLYSEPMLAQGLLASPLFALSENRVPVFNLLTTLTLAANALAAHWLARQAMGAGAGAAAGAIVYTFNSYNFSHLPRMQLISLQWLPLAFLCLHRFALRRKAADAWVFVLSLLLQGLSCLYYLAFSIVAVCAMLPCYLRATNAWRDRRFFTRLIAPGLVGAGAITLVALPYVRLYAQYGIQGDVGRFDLAGFVRPPARTLLYPAQESTSAPVDHFLGYIALGFTAWGAGVCIAHRERWRSVWWGYLLVALAALLLAGGPDIVVAVSRWDPGRSAFSNCSGPLASCTILIVSRFWLACRCPSSWPPASRVSSNRLPSRLVRP